MAKNEISRPATAHIPPFGLRLQPELKSQIEEAARTAGRSMNAEIVYRLEQSFAPRHGTAPGMTVTTHTAMEPGAAYSDQQTTVTPVQLAALAQSLEESMRRVIESVLHTEKVTLDRPDSVVVDTDKGLFHVELKRETGKDLPADVKAAAAEVRRQAKAFDRIAVNEIIRRPEPEPAQLVQEIPEPKVLEPKAQKPQRRASPKR